MEIEKKASGEALNEDFDYFRVEVKENPKKEDFGKAFEGYEKALKVIRLDEFEEEKRGFCPVCPVWSDVVKNEVLMEKKWEFQIINFFR